MTRTMESRTVLNGLIKAAEHGYCSCLACQCLQQFALKSTAAFQTLDHVKDHAQGEPCRLERCPIMEWIALEERKQ